jgi:oligosaccharide repeat unit polymerase
MILLFPLLLVAVAAWFFMIQARRRHGKPQYLDLGLAFLLVVTVYGTLPGLGLALASLGIGEITDSRVSDNLSFDLVLDVELMFLCFAIGLAAAYLLTRKFPTAQKQAEKPKRRQVIALVFLAAGLNLGLLLARSTIGAQQSTDYIETYLELRDLPLAVQQVFNLASQVAFSSVVAAVVFFVAWRPSKHLLVASVLVFFVGLTIFGGGSRTLAFLSLFAYFVAASVFVPKFSMRRLMPLGALAIFLFLLAGSMRGGNETGALGMLQENEFMSVFINALDLHERVLDGQIADPGFSLYLTDLMRLLPTQFIGAKVDPAVWYVETFYPGYYAAGGGLAFGVIAESVLGYGVVEAFSRGALLGLILALSANWLRPESKNPLKVFVYVWLVVMSYHAFRDTTLSLAIRALFQVAPVLLLLLAISPKSPAPHFQRASRLV